MGPATEIIRIGQTEVTVEYKNVKHLHLSVHPPHGEVRAVVPKETSSEKVRLFVVSRLGWVRRKARAMEAQPRRSPRQFTEGESVFVWGKQYRLRLLETSGRHTIKLAGDWLELFVQPGTDRAGRRRAIHGYYREELKQALPRMARHWEAKTGLKATEYRIKMMYTKWGSCNVEAGRVWVNLELAKHDSACLNYILLHELLHLQERGHTDVFLALLTKFLPSWRSIRNQLNTGFPGLPALD